MIIPKALPDQNDLVLIKVKKVMPHGAYCELLEYNMDAYLPVKEVASGWIKNIHEFIKEGQKTVAKVIYVDRQHRSIDISLKKTRKKEKKDKINDENLEKRGEGLFEQAIATAKAEDAKETIKTELSHKFQTYSELVDTVFLEEDALKGLNLDKVFADAFTELIHKTIKPKVYTVSYIAKLTIFNTLSGINVLRELLSDMEKTGVSVTYMGAPNYMLVASDSSYPLAEEKIKKAEEVLEKYSKKEDLEYSMKKERSLNG